MDDMTASKEQIAGFPGDVASSNGAWVRGLAARCGKTARALVPLCSVRAMQKFPLHGQEVAVSCLALASR